MVVTFFICSIVADRILVLFKFPSELSEQVAHPPNYQQQIETLEFKYLFQTNSQGLRYHEIPLEKPAGSYRVFVVGDSFTEGYGVAEGQRFTEFLEKTFSSQGRETRFINGGLSGTGPDEYARIFFNVGLKYHPDALLICLYANDLVGTPQKLNLSMLYNTSPKLLGYKRILHLIWPRTFTAVTKIIDSRNKKRATQTSDFIRDVTRKAREKKIPEERIAAWKVKIPQSIVDAINQGRLSGSAVARGLLHPTYWQRCFNIDSPDAEEKFQKMILILNELAGYCRKHKIDVAVVYIPSPYQYDPSVHDPESMDTCRLSGVVLEKRWLTEKTRVEQRMEFWAGSAAVPFLNLTPALRQTVQQNGSINHLMDGHFTAQGQRVAGEIIAQWIRKDKVFPIK